MAGLMVAIANSISSNYVVSAGGGFDPNAEAFITAAGITDPTQQNAINELVLDLKAASIWTKFNALYPIIGGTATTHKYNLKNPLDTDAAFRLAFATGMTHSSTGMVSNGASGYANTSLIPQTFYSTNMHLSYYSRTSTIQTVQEIGANQSTNYSSLAVARNTIFGQTTNGLVNYLSQSNALGFFVGQKVSNSSRKVYRNGTLNNSTTTTDSNTLPNNNVYICALNVNNTPANYSIKQCAFASIGDGLTDTESQLFYQIVEKYQVALSRNINPTQSFYYNRNYNNETNAFLFATQITDTTQQTAVNTLVDDFKSAGIWTKMKAVYPIVGGTAATHKFNLVNPQDTDAAFRLAFSTGWTHSSTGMTGNGTSAYADTYLIPQSSLTTNSTHVSYYSRTNSIEAGTALGCINSINGAGRILLFPRWSDANLYSDQYNETTNRILVANSNSTGFYISNRSGANTFKVHKNNSVFGTNTNTASIPSTMNTSITINGYNAGGGSIGALSARQCAFASIGDGLTDAEAANFYTAVQAFQTTLGRQV